MAENNTFKITDPEEQRAFTVGPQPHPGTFLHAHFDDLGLKIAEAARRLRMDRASLSNVLHGKSALTDDLALKVEALTGLDAELLIAMQANYERDNIRPAKRERYFREIERMAELEAA